MILLPVFLCNTKATAQKSVIHHDGSLHWMPKTERDSILLAVSKEALLKYGPEYYKDTHQVVVEDLGIYSKIEDYEGLRMYKVTYIYDKRVEQLAEDFAAEVYVRSDNGRVIRIWFGNMLGLRGLDTNLPDRSEDIVMPYQQKHEMERATFIQGRTIYYEEAPNGTTIYYILDDNGNQIRTDEEGNEITFERGTKKNTP